MGLFGSKLLNYRVGNESLAKVRQDKYFRHTLPGEISSPQMNFEILQEEANNGKYDEILGKAIDFASTFDYVSADYDYLNRKSPDMLEPDIEDSNLDDTAQAMAYLANLAKRNINEAIRIYFEQLPYLEKFESNLGVALNVQERKILLFLMRIGMALSLIENNSGVNLPGFAHPSISNIIHTPIQVLMALSKRAVNWNLDAFGHHDNQKRVAQLVIHVGYFQSKYTAEFPHVVMSEVKPLRD
jgi:hypothetical protein